MVLDESEDVAFPRPDQQVLVVREQLRRRLSDQDVVAVADGIERNIVMSSENTRIALLGDRASMAAK